MKVFRVALLVVFSVIVSSCGAGIGESAVGQSGTAQEAKTSQTVEDNNKEAVQESVRARIELAGEIKDFLEDYGFIRSEYYMEYSEDEKAILRWCLATGSNEVHETYLSLNIERVNSENECYSAQEDGVDVYYMQASSYSDPDGSATPLTRNLIDIPRHWFIKTAIHEEFHYSFDLIWRNTEEPAAMLIGLALGLEFTNEKYGEDSEASVFLEEALASFSGISDLFEEYHGLLTQLYDKADAMTPRELEVEKKELYSRFKSECKELGLKIYRNTCELENNAAFSFWATYWLNFGTYYDLYLSKNGDMELVLDSINKARSRVDTGSGAFTEDLLNALKKEIDS